MKKLFAVMLIPFFLTSLSVVSTEKTIALTNEEKYQLTSNVVAETTYFDSIPTNPILAQDSSTYKDTALTTVSDTLLAGDTLSIVDLTINDSAIPVFELSDGSYIEASRQFIYDDVVISQENISKEYWLEDGFKVYQAPYVTGTKEVKTDLTSYSEVTVTQKATTYHGTYYKVDGKGWISDDDLSATDNRMEKVQQVLNQKYNKSNYSIYVKQLSTQTTAGINADTVMYSASVAKLATLYYVEEKLQDGTISANDTLKYVDTVNSFAKAYDPSGSGKISKTADNKEYTIDDLLKAVAQNSDNVATNILGYYVANQYDDDFNSEISAIAGTDIDMKARNMSSKTAANLMEAIYNQDGDIISYLSSTAFDTTRISRDIDVQVAHKIGDAYDYKHDVAIIYADEPFILSIFTNNASYDDISNIANDVYAILK
ncbi:serine hydrolase [Streptococcus gallolyticus]|uniref:serine hydrolase n=1 Tax=Streptococcus gallolyticus TaxID=315405 RepID=UPI00088C7989|nr:serine hydrolase [Streptococcus gallolyticus]SDK21533.1 beta-lactamase class C [Streptococcus gallolyticus]SDL74271.1 beta-lactamase class C [Streptococcus gallolyticus]